MRRILAALVLAAVTLPALAGCPSTGGAQHVCEQPTAGSEVPTDCPDTGDR